MENILQNALQSVRESEISFSKFITANDTGTTGGHQSGFHIHKSAWTLFFDSPGQKGTNKDKWITIKWQGDFETSSRVIYYGVGTRNEYRLTRFGRGFPFLSDDNVGNLLIICKKSSDYYEAFVLRSDDDIEDFLYSLNLSITDVNKIIQTGSRLLDEDTMYQCFIRYLNSLRIDFPPAKELSLHSRLCFNNSFRITNESVIKEPDKTLLQWLDSEYQLFKIIEHDRYAERLKSVFSSVEELVTFSNTVLNRRKSRAGKSLENNLEEVFLTCKISFDTQVSTEGNKIPDFLFPNQTSYRNPSFDANKLCMMASKTTCKDRWRQILNEADRIRVKHLFTLQQGISSNQLEEMVKSNVQLVVPNPYLTCFPEPYRDKIMSLNDFVNFVKSIQS